MIWWIVAGVAVGALVVLVAAVALTRNGLVELQRVADLSAQQAARDQQRLQVRVARVQASMAGLERRSAETQRLVGRLRRPDVR